MMVAAFLGLLATVVVLTLSAQAVIKSVTKKVSANFENILNARMRNLYQF
jgi:hypothetical protein